MKSNITGRLWTREFILYLGLTIFSFLFMSMNNPIIPVYIAGKFECSTTEVGLITNAFIMSAMVARPFAGYAIDRWGRRWMLFGALVGYLLGNFSLLLPLSITSLLIIRILVGLPFSIITNVLSTLASDIVPESRRSESMSYFAIVSTLVGAALASNFGLMLYGDGNYIRSFAVSGIIPILGMIILFSMRFIDIRDPKAVFSFKSLFEGKVIWLALVQCLGWSGASSALTYSPLYAQSAGFTHFGFFYVLYGMGLISSRFLTKLTYEKKGPKTTGTLALVSLITGYALIGIIHTEAGLWAGGLFLGTGYGLLNSALLAMAMHLVRPERRGACSATMFFGQDAGISLGSIFLGKIIDTTGSYTSAYSVASIFMIVPLLLFLGVALRDFSRKKQELA